MITSPLKTPKVDADRCKELSSFQKKTGLKFRKINLLDMAFCHRSFVNETVERIDNNERLEFLGDSVLGLVVVDYLYRFLPDRPEGDLARIKAHVVSEESLADVALELGIDALVRLGRGEELSGGRQKKALLADSMEAVIGAFYLDAGFDKAAKFVLSLLKVRIDTVLEDRHRKDYKTLLQEYVQKHYRCYPKYMLEKKSGPDHQQKFWINVSINDQVYGHGSGTSKKAAEQEAASAAWNALSAKVPGRSTVI